MWLNPVVKQLLTGSLSELPCSSSLPYQVGAGAIRSLSSGGPLTMSEALDLFIVQVMRACHKTLPASFLGT